MKFIRYIQFVFLCNHKLCMHVLLTDCKCCIVVVTVFTIVTSITSPTSVVKYMCLSLNKQDVLHIIVVHLVKYFSSKQTKKCSIYRTQNRIKERDPTNYTLDNSDKHMFWRILESIAMFGRLQNKKIAIFIKRMHIKNLMHFDRVNLDIHVNVSW